MCGDEAVMKPHGHLVERIDSIADLKTHIVAEILNIRGNLRPMHPDIRVRSSELSGPLPRSVKHPPMKLLQHWDSQQIATQVATPSRPQNCVRDIDGFELVQLAVR
jgi:hypothetical protein